MSKSLQGEAPDRSGYLPATIIRELWTDLRLPTSAIDKLTFDTVPKPLLPSSFKIGHLAYSAATLSALTAALVYAQRQGKQPSASGVRVCPRRAVAEFNTEKLHSITGYDPGNSKWTWRKVGGLHQTVDGWVRIHSEFPNHALGALRLLGLPEDATRDDVTDQTKKWESVALETRAIEHDKLAVYALRTPTQWAALPQSEAVANQPVLLSQISPGPVKILNSTTTRRCLDGVRIVELSRVLAAPVSGKTLASHGADVVWVTSPHLPDLPHTDRDVSRGKRSVQLDLNISNDKQKLIDLLRTCDVFIQGYRPGSLAAKGLSPEELCKINPSIIVANLSAFGIHGPWSSRRGFDSLVQTCSGMNVSEAEHAGRGEPARPMPCQSLDHAGGFLLATGVTAALYRRATEGGSWRVDVSLAAVMKYLKSLGQYPGASGFEEAIMSIQGMDDVPKEWLETTETDYGKMTALRSCAEIDGLRVGWDRGPRRLGSDVPEWL